jgi:hypothetical protein
MGILAGARRFSAEGRLTLPFAIRCGGHSFAGFSQSPQAGIDVHGIDAMAARRVDRTAKTGGQGDTGLWSALDRS